MPSAKKKPVPEFRSEDEEREFWADHDSTEFIDWRSAERSKFPNLKPTLRTISLRLPVSMIEDLKVLANRRDVPYQSLLKVFLAERLKRSAGGHSAVGFSETNGNTRSRRTASYLIRSGCGRLNLPRALCYLTLMPRCCAVTSVI